jgi:hypothetical protein
MIGKRLIWGILSTVNDNPAHRPFDCAQGMGGRVKYKSPPKQALGLNTKLRCIIPAKISPAAGVTVHGVKNLDFGPIQAI